MRRIRLYLLFALVISPSSLALANAIECKTLFEDELSAALMAKSLVDKLPWDLWKVQIQESRLSAAESNGVVDVVKNAIFDIELNDGFHRSSAVYYSKKISPQLTSQVPVATTSRWSKNLFETVRDKAMDFVIENYRKRRPHWPSNFHEKLLKLAKEYENESTYITVENKPWADTQMTSTAKAELELVGTIRLIHEKKGQVPMEDYLGIQIKTRDDQIKIEPGNLAAAHEGNEVAWVQFAIQMMAQMKRYRAEFGKEPLFVTYADGFSEKLYGGMGFQYLTAVHLKNPPAEASENGPVRIEKNDVEWAPMYATEAMLIEHLMSRLSRAASKRKSERLLKQLLEALERTVKSVNATPEIFVGTNTQQNNVARLYIQRQQDEARLYLQPQYEYERRVFRANVTVTVPLPLTEGAKGITAAGISYHYSNGVLTFSELNKRDSSFENQTYRLAIDSMLLQPVSMRAIHLNGMQTLQDSTFQF